MTLPFNYRVIQKKYATGKPDQKDLSENLAAAQGLAHMITECDRLFEVSERFQQPSSSSWSQIRHLGWWLHLRLIGLAPDFTMTVVPSVALVFASKKCEELAE